MKKKNILIERPEIDFSSHFSDRKTFDKDITVFNKLKQLIQSLEPFNGGRFTLEYRLHTLFLRAFGIKIKNLSDDIKNNINDRHIETLTTIAQIVVIENLIPYVMNSLKKIDDAEYNGSIFKYIAPKIENFSAEEAVKNSIKHDHITTTISVFNNDYLTRVTCEIALDIAVDPNDKFIEYVDTGQEQIDLGQSKKLKITKENFQILKNAGLLTQVQGKSWQQFFGGEQERTQKFIPSGTPQIYYVIQSICDKCGSPRGIEIVGRRTFEKYPGKEYQGLQRHSYERVGIPQDSDVLVKINFKQCGRCEKKL